MLNSSQIDFADNLQNEWETNGKAIYRFIGENLFISACLRNGITAENTVIATGLPTGYIGSVDNPSMNGAGGRISLTNDGNLFIQGVLGGTNLSINIIAIKD